MRVKLDFEAKKICKKISDKKLKKFLFTSLISSDRVDPDTFEETSVFLFSGGLGVTYHANVKDEERGIFDETRNIFQVHHCNSSVVCFNLNFMIK